MQTTITKSVPVSVKTRGGNTQTIDTVPPWVTLSFVTYTVKRGRYEVTDWLGVPLEQYADSCLTGYRVTAELAAWTKQHPSHARDVLKSVLEAAQSIMAQPIQRPAKVDALDKRGAAMTVFYALLDLLASAARQFDPTAYCNGGIESTLASQAFYAKREADRRRDFVQRMQAARASKNASTKFASGNVSQKTSNTSNKK